MHTMPTRRLAAAAFTLAVAASPAMAQDAPAPAIIRIVHGIPGRDVAPSLDPQLPVDVLVDNKLCILQGFTFGSVSQPFSLPAGSYNVKVSLADSVTPCGNPPVIRQDVTVSAGEEAAVVAALNGVGQPVAEAFAIDLSPIPASQGRVIVAHAADAPPVAVSVNGKVAIRGLDRGTEASAQLPAGTYTVAVYPNGTRTPVIGPLPLTVSKRTATLVFAVGSAGSGSITVVVDAIPEVF
jgi:hypothetical protein